LVLDVAAADLQIEEEKEVVLAGKVDVGLHRVGIDVLEVEGVVAGLRLRSFVDEVKGRLHTAEAVQVVEISGMIPEDIGELIWRVLAEDAKLLSIRIAVVGDDLVRGEERPVDDGGAGIAVRESGNRSGRRIVDAGPRRRGCG